jgi:hypothetical protein
MAFTKNQITLENRCLLGYTKRYCTMIGLGKPYGATSMYSTELLGWGISSPSCFIPSI